MTVQPATKKRPVLLIVLGAIGALCAICVIGSVAMDSLGLLPTSTPSPIPSSTVPPTSTLPPTVTPSPLPSNTPLPSLTPTPLPEPITLTGSGDSVVDIQKWNSAAIMKVKHNGGGNFAIFNDDASGNHIDLLVNTIGVYEGTLPLDFLDNQYTTRFEITAGGAWEIQILPLQMIRRDTIPGVIQGKGDEVLAFDTSAVPDLLKIDASTAGGNFAIWTYGSTRDLVVNEIAPYSGTVAIDRDTIILVITAEGNWSMEVTTR